MTKRLTSAMIGLGLGVTLVTVPVFAAETSKELAHIPPGVMAEKLQELDLGELLKTNKGQSVQLLRTVIPPGLKTEPHSHEGLPELTYVLSGKVTEHRGDVTRTYSAGESYPVVHVTHWIENKETVPAVLIAVRVLPKD